MKITVIGATGRTGRHVVANGIQRGHHITAFTRRPHLLAGIPTPAAVITGDGRDPDAIRSAVDDADAVVAIIAAASRSGPHQAAQVARTLTSVMSRTGVRRLVITSAYPIVGDKPRLAMALLRRIFADAYADAIEMEDHITATDMDWTIVRLNRLTDQPGRGRLTLSRELLDKPTSIPRTDAATALLNIAETNHHAKTTVNVSSQ